MSSTSRSRDLSARARPALRGQCPPSRRRERGRRLRCGSAPSLRRQLRLRACSARSRLTPSRPPRGRPPLGQCQAWVHTARTNPRARCRKSRRANLRASTEARRPQQKCVAEAVLWRPRTILLREAPPRRTPKSCSPQIRSFPRQNPDLGQRCRDRIAARGRRRDPRGRNRLTRQQRAPPLCHPCPTGAKRLGLKRSALQRLGPRRRWGRAAQSTSERRLPRGRAPEAVPRLAPALRPRPGRGCSAQNPRRQSGLGQDRRRRFLLR